MGFMVVTAFLSMWISNTATTAMMIPIVHAILVQLRENRETVVVDVDLEDGVDGTELGTIKYNTTSSISNIEQINITTTICTHHWKEEESYCDPPPTLINIHCQCKIKQKMKETKCIESQYNHILTSPMCQCQCGCHYTMVLIWCSVLLLKQQQIYDHCLLYECLVTGNDFSF